jgi:hypothetical protein
MNELWHSYERELGSEDLEMAETLSRVGKGVNAVAAVNLALSIMQFLLVIITAYHGGQTYFRSIWSYFDIIYSILNTLISLSVIIDAFIDIVALRILEAILAIVIVIKLLYFLQLIDQIAPLVNVIILVFEDIGWFIMVFVTIIFAIATSYYLIGQN